MCITAYSLTMACVWTSVLAVVMYVIQKNKQTLQYFGIKNMLILYAFCIIRMLVPIEFPITRTVSAGALYNTVTRFCTKELLNGLLHISDLFLIIWCCGTVINAYRLIKDYQTTKRTIRACAMNANEPAYEVLWEMQREQKDKRIIKVYTMPCEIPMVVGIWRPVILLTNREYRKKELYYIIKHEYTHVLNRDTTVKLLLNLWSCVFWWNPIMYLLYDNMENTLELKCDFMIVKQLGSEEKAQYLAAILSALKTLIEEKGHSSLPKSMNALYKVNRQAELLKRFQCISKYSNMTEQTKMKYQRYIAVMFIVYTIIFCASYGFVFQSKFDPPVEEVVTEEGVYEIRPGNTFLREKEGRYEIICENQCVGDVGKDTALLMMEEGFEMKQEEDK